MLETPEVTDLLEGSAPEGHALPCHCSEALDCSDFANCCDLQDATWLQSTRNVEIGMRDILWTFVCLPETCSPAPKSEWVGLH